MNKNEDKAVASKSTSASISGTIAYIRGTESNVGSNSSRRTINKKPIPKTAPINVSEAVESEIR